MGRFARSTPSGFVLSHQMVLRTRLPGTPSKPEQLIGEAQEETENYDLMSVVMICLGKPGTENHKGILKFMEVLLSSTRSGSEKKKILEEEFGVAMSEELEREVLEVCNLSQGVRAEGREEGRQEGRWEGILEGIRATVRTCRNFNISETDTVRNIMNEFSLSQEEAVNYVKKYW